MRHRARLTSQSLVGREGVRTRVGVCVLAIVVSLCGAAARAQGSPEARGLRTVGVVKSIGSGTITVTADSGEEVSASLQADTKIVRVAPGEKDLKSATQLRVEDVKVGDRVLVRGLPMAGGQTLKAVTVIVMKQEDVASKQEREREDWQKRGVGGLVTAVDAAAGTITVSMGASGPGAMAKTLTVRINKDTILRRYAANSIKFDDAKRAPIGDIKPGDQLRARGAKNADGSEIAADEVISGSFRNIAGIILAKDEGATTITVQDAITKKTVTVKLGEESTLKALPTEMAQRIAMRLKGGAGGAGAPGGGGQGGGNSGGSAAGGASGGGMRPQSGWTGGGAGGPGAAGGGPPDLQRFLSRLPSKGLADLNKGDAVMIVATEGGDGRPVTAITLLAGVEPILTAAPNGGSTLSSWTLGSSMGEGGPQ
jgi:co-chaperonin GroES (HSP10)